MIFKQTVWNYACSMYKTKHKISKSAPTNNCTKTKVTNTNEITESKINKIDCSLVKEIINSDFYYLDGVCLINSRIDDILHGVCRLDLGGNSRPLSKVVLLNLFNQGDVLYLKDIQDVVGCGVRQAQRYLKALKIAERMIINL